jgi:hypothetical protein
MVRISLRDSCHAWLLRAPSCWPICSRLRHHPTTASENFTDPLFHNQRLDQLEQFLSVHNSCVLQFWRSGQFQKNGKCPCETPMARRLRAKSPYTPLPVIPARLWTTIMVGKAAGRLALQHPVNCGEETNIGLCRISLAALLCCTGITICYAHCVKTTIKQLRAELPQF